jgi:hypothetical protein
MFALTFIIALAISALAALPGDYARRRHGNAFNVVSAAGVLIAIGSIAALGYPHGFAGIAVLVLGLAAGQQLADTVASRRWGPIAGAR